MSKKTTVRIPHKDASYDIIIADGLLSSDALLDCCRGLGKRGVIISDTITEKLFGQRLKQFLIDHGFDIQLFSFNPGEHYKTRQTKEQLENQMLKHGFGRDSFLIALGGGIVTDVGGFVASTYCRGIPFITVPTTLLAMVDASIGGKTGVNVPEGKNLIGTISQPHAIFMDTSTLKSLPKHELKNGLAECIKHGLILDADYFRLLEANVEAILAQEMPLTEEVIYQSCRIKQQIVEQDEHETGIRRLLNFGHTFGHAIETVTNHAIPHGQAVAIGMLAAGYLSMELNELSKNSFERIVEVIKRYQIETTLQMPITSTQLLQAMKMDKKSVQSVTRFVLLKDIGIGLDCDQQYCKSVDADVLNTTLEWLCGIVRQH